MSHISICFAVYQNQDSLPILYEKIVSEMEKNFPQHSFELLFVNDGSKDNSFSVLMKLRDKDPRVKIISFSRNFGQGPAIIAGWKYANGDAVVNMAADLQDPPEQVTRMIKEWENGSEIVVSYRESHKTSLLNKFTSRLFFKLVLPGTPPGGFDFALLGRKALNAINLLKERNRFYHYDILWAGFNVKFIPYHKQKREHGKSAYNFTKRFAMFVKAYINVSYLPVRIMTFLGFLFAFLGLIYTVLIVHAYFAYQTPYSGWAPLMILLLIIGGLIMVMLGILGEYIWRIFDEVKGRPTYVIKDYYE